MAAPPAPSPIARVAQPKVPLRPDVGTVQRWPLAGWSLRQMVPVVFMPFGIVLVAEILVVAQVGLRGGAAGFLLTLVQQLALLVPVLWWVRTEFGSTQPLGLWRGGWTKADVFAGFGVGIGALFLNGALMLLTIAIYRAATGHDPSLPDQVDAFGKAWLIPSMVLATVFAPVCEEVFFRGFVFGGLRRRFRFRWAALLSGVFFGFMHADPLRFFALSVTGVVFAAVFERRQRLAASMVAHATLNIVVVVFALPTR